MLQAWLDISCCVVECRSPCWMKIYTWKEQMRLELAGRPSQDGTVAGMYVLFAGICDKPVNHMKL